MNSVYVVRSKCNYGDASIERVFEAKEDAVAFARTMAETLGAVDTTEEDMGDMGTLVSSWTGKEDYVWVTEHAVVQAEVKLPGGTLKKEEEDNLDPWGNPKGFLENMNPWNDLQDDDPTICPTCKVKAIHGGKMTVLGDTHVWTCPKCGQVVHEEL